MPTKRNTLPGGPGTPTVHHPRAARNGRPTRYQRGMKRPDGQTWAGAPFSPLLSVTASRKPFAVVARTVLADRLLPDGAFVLLAVLASLHRGSKALCLSASELAVSQGVCPSAHYERRHRLIGLGYLDESGALKPEHRPSAAAKAEGGFAKVDLAAVHGLPPQAVRALAALSDRCDRRKRSRARVAKLAAASGRSVRAWYRRVCSAGRRRVGLVEGALAGPGPRHRPDSRFRKTSHSIPENVTLHL